jgi:hypothetical protein
MKRFWVLRGMKLLVLAAVAIAVLGYVVMSLWNAVIPGVTGLHAITYLQALALLVLSRILFGGLVGRGRRGWHWRARMQERWQQMTPEERKHFRDLLGSRHRCCQTEGSDHPPASPAQ